jgi:MFS family permease
MRWIRLLYLINGLSVGSLYFFIPVLLAAKGYDPALIGLTAGLGSVAYTVAMPLWGHLGDEVLGPRRALQVASVPAAVFALGLGMPLPFPAILLCQLIVSIGGSPALALTDAMAVPVMADPSREYSRIRILTSIGAAAGAVGFGAVYTFTGYMVAPLMFVALMAITIVCAELVPLGRGSGRSRRALEVSAAGMRAASNASHGGRFGSVGEAFVVRPRLAAVLVSTTLIFTGVMSAGTYLGLRVSDLGGGPIQVGLANGIASGAEVPGMFLAAALMNVIGARRLLTLSALGFAACTASWIWLTDTLVIMAIRFVSGIFFAGMIVSLVLVVASMLPRRLQSTGQTLLQACTFGLAAILANTFGGVLYQVGGPMGVFGGGALCAVAGGLFALVALPGGPAVAVAPERGPEPATRPGPLPEPAPDLVPEEVPEPALENAPASLASELPAA